MDYLILTRSPVLKNGFGSSADYHYFQHVQKHTAPESVYLIKFLKDIVMEYQA